MKGAECSCHLHKCLRSFHTCSPILQIRATEAQEVKQPLAGTQLTQTQAPAALGLGLLASTRL